MEINMALSTQPVKGARDFYPEDMRLQKYIFGVWRTVCEQFGYQEYDAPILEPTDLYLAKGNEEIINEQTYSFADRGGRNLTLRTEMTPTVSRMVAARRQEMAYPARLYSIPQCWRYERMQRGRGREFYQLNVDVFGLSGIEAEQEMVTMADQILKSYGAKESAYTIKLSSRVLVDTYLRVNLGLDETQTQSLIRLVDRMNKMESAAFIALVEAIFTPSQREAGIASGLFAFLNAKTLADLPADVQQLEATRSLTELISRLSAAGIDNAEFDPTLMRGFDYYTDIVFEVFDTNPENNRSMFGGGRFDGLVAQFGVEPVPTVGFAMGDITLRNFLEAHGLLPKLRPETDLYVVVLGAVDVTPAAAELREMGLNVAVDYSGRKLDKQIKSAEKMGMHYVLFVGEQELETGQFSLKNIQTGAEERHGLQRIVSIVRDYRSA
jgi:histidyl-tRNA synthetase